LSNSTACFGAAIISAMLPLSAFSKSAPTLLAACGRMPNDAPVCSASLWAAV